MALVLLALIDAPSTAAQTLRGVVLYTHTDTPVQFATVRLVDELGRVRRTVESDVDGRFVIPVSEDGAYSVQVEHLSAFSMVDGPLQLSKDAGTTFVAFHVVPQPFALEEIAVDVEARSMSLARTGFYQREQRELGFFIDPTEIRARNPVRASDLLRSVPGVQYSEARAAGAGGYPIMSYALRSDLWGESVGAGSIPCFPRVYLDGQIAETGGRVVPGAGFDQLVAAHDIAALEVYRRPAELPIRFGGFTACGVILIWTHAGWNRPG